MIHEADKLLKNTWRERFDNLPAPAKVALKLALNDLHEYALLKAQHSWKKHKAPMALYWKVVGVYAGHLARAIKLPSDNRKQKPNKDAPYVPSLGYQRPGP